MKYYQTMVSVEVLSEAPLHPNITLHEIHDAITTGDCSGQVTHLETEVDGPTMAMLLIKQGSEPEFFGLEKQGQPLSS